MKKVNMEALQYYVNYTLELFTDKPFIKNTLMEKSEAIVYEEEEKPTE